MKKWIRPQGIIAFIVLIAVIVILSFVLSGTIIERGIEKAGTAIVGAKVDVGNARLSLSPLGLTIGGLQVTNAKRPMENTVQVDRIAFNMNLGALVQRKLLVEEMSLEGMAFNTPRKSSGAVAKPVKDGKQEGPDSGLKRLAQKIPSASEILAKEDLPSVERSNALKKSSAAARESTDDALGSLPDKARVEEYQKRLDTLLAAKGLTKARIEEAKTLQKELRAERDKVKAAEDKVTSSISTFKTQLKEARESVGEDVSMLMDKYALTPGGIANITRTLFGDSAGVWADRGVQALKLLSYLPSGSEKDPGKVKPPRGKGVDIPLTDKIRLPDLWVKKADLSLKIPAGVIAGEAIDISSDQAMLEKPSTFRVSGQDLQGGAALTASGTLDRTVPTEPKDEVKLRYAGWTVSDFKLSESESLPVTLRKGSGKVDGSVIMKGETLEGTVRIDLASVVLEAGGAGGTTVTSALRTALKGVQKFTVTADVGGTLDDPRIRLSSDLDALLKGVVSQAGKEEAAKLEAGLRAGIEEKTEPALADAQRSIASLEKAKAELASIKAGLEEALKAKAAVKLPF